MERINILHVYKTSMPSSYGGVESFIDTLCKTDSLLGVNNAVLTLSPHPQKSPIDLMGYTVYQAKQNLFVASTGFSLAAFDKFNKLASQSDIIHYHFPNPFADILHTVCRPKIPCIVTYHSDIVRQKNLLKVYQPLMKRFLDSVDRIVATSPNYCMSSEVLNRYLEKVSVIPIGIDLGTYEFVNSERLKYWSKRLRAPFFLFVGALRYYKGLHIALKAIAGTGIQLVIAGNSGNEDELKMQALSLGLDNVDFLGSITEEDKIALLRLCYGFIFPSHLRSEAFGISLLEAAAAGKPMISCEIGTGTTFVNMANETGIVVSPGAVEELRSAMQYLLDNPSVARLMGEAARKRSQALFSAEQQGLAYRNLYRELLSDHYGYSGQFEDCVPKSADSRSS